MTTQSKSVLVPFLIIAGLIFTVAVAWKFLGNHDEDTVVKSSEVEMTAPIKSERNFTIENSENPTVVDYDDSDLPFIDYSEEDRKAGRQQAKVKMQYAMRFSTFDKAIAGLDNLRAKGNDQSAEELIEFIYSTYPNETIPADLLE